MKTITIDQKERGLLFKNGLFIKPLLPGKYRCRSRQEIEVVSLDAPLAPAKGSIEAILTHPDVAKETIVVDVEDEKLALHYIDGKFTEALRPGRYVFWSVYASHTFTMADTSNPEVNPEIPTYIFQYMPGYLFVKIEVAQYQKGRLFIDQKLTKVLEPGVYYFWRTVHKVSVDLVDTRQKILEINGQEILSLDKVGLRINFVCTYRITDYIKVLTEIDNYQDQMRLACQLALREYVGQYRLDELLENKEKIAEYVLIKLQEKAKNFYVEIIDTGVKDIILPGEIRNIMNTVLMAEKRAQANVITRREEVASTRSLLNTARLMDENKTLYKLKELEYLEKICEHVGNITVSGNDSLISQLSSILQKP